MVKLVMIVVALSGNVNIEVYHNGTLMPAGGAHSGLPTCEQLVRHYYSMLQPEIAQSTQGKALSVDYTCEEDT